RPRGPGRRNGDHDDRGAGARRRAPPSAAGLPRAARVAVRLLHAGNGDGDGLDPEGEPESERGGDPARARGEPLPLHRLSQHRQGGAGRRGCRFAVTVIGQAIPRKEDARLLTGEARFVDDLTFPGTVYAYLVRSPYA